MTTFLKLNDEQSFALDKFIEEHNVAITGQAGTGKSFLIRSCVEELDRMDRKRAVLCTTGIGCMQYAERFLDRMPEHIGVGLDSDPRHARNSRSSIDEGVRQLRRLLRHPRVIAFGDVGLDHTEPLKYWAYQVELLEKVLPYLEDRHVLVIHCRGMIGDCGTEAFLLLLHFLKKNVRQHQQIHLHCFTGNSYVLDRWLEVFPRTYFGSTNKVGRFNRHQREALCKIDENRLLLQSDAPYFPIEGETVSSPSQLYVLAETMAAHRQLTVERMLEVTVANALHLYHGQQYDDEFPGNA